MFITLFGLFVVFGTLKAFDGVEKRGRVLCGAEFKYTIPSDSLINYEVLADVDDEESLLVEHTSGNERIWENVEECPEFPGGDRGLSHYLEQNIRYPKVSRNAGTQGKVFVSFVINTDGGIQDVEILKSSGDYFLDKEAARLVKSMPNWKPGRINAKPVCVKYVLPINFCLQ